LGIVDKKNPLRRIPNGFQEVVDIGLGVFPDWPTEGADLGGVFAKPGENEEHPGNLTRQWGVLAHMFRLTLKYRGKNFDNSVLHSGVREYVSNHPRAPVNLFLEAEDMANFHVCRDLVNKWCGHDESDDEIDED
jgi:hypothetical protein